VTYINLVRQYEGLLNGNTKQEAKVELGCRQSAGQKEGGSEKGGGDWFLSRPWEGGVEQGGGKWGVKVRRRTGQCQLYP
jgi:hypothetical protein